MPGRKRIPKDDLYDLTYQESYFLRHIKQDPNSECQIWDGPKHRQGYGMMGAWREDGTKIMTTTHRIAARRKFQRALDDSEMVIHTCSNPACVSEDHLILGDRFTVHTIMRKNNRYAKTRKKPV